MVSVHGTEERSLEICSAISGASSKPRKHLRFDALPCGCVGETDVGDLTVSNQVVQSSEGLLDGCGRVPSTHAVKIDVARAETPQGLFASANYGLAAPLTQRLVTAPVPRPACRLIELGPGQRRGKRGPGQPRSAVQTANVKRGGVRAVRSLSCESARGRRERASQSAAGQVSRLRSSDRVRTDPRPSNGRPRSGSADGAFRVVLTPTVAAS